MSTDFNKRASEWMSENGGRMIFTLVDLTAEDGTTIPHDSILFIHGASGVTDDRVNAITLQGAA